MNIGQLRDVLARLGVNATTRLQVSHTSEAALDLLAPAEGGGERRVLLLATDASQARDLGELAALLLEAVSDGAEPPAEDERPRSAAPPLADAFDAAVRALEALVPDDATLNPATGAGAVFVPAGEGPVVQVLLRGRSDRPVWNLQAEVDAEHALCFFVQSLRRAAFVSLDLPSLDDGRTFAEGFQRLLIAVDVVQVQVQGRALDSTKHQALEQALLDLAQAIVATPLAAFSAAVEAYLVARQEAPCP